MKAYRIVGWNERYEVTDQGRAAKPGEPCRVNPLPYVRLKVHGFSQGPGYRSLQVVAGSRRNLEGAFAVFCKLLELSADQKREDRGWVLNHRGQPATIEDLAFYMGFTKSIISKALVILSDPRVAWLEAATCTNLQEPTGTYKSLQDTELNLTELNGTELNKDVPPEKPAGKEKPTSKGKPTKEKKPRKPNPIWDAVCKAFKQNPVTKKERTRIGGIVRDLKLKKAKPEEIPQRVKNFKTHWPEITVTPEAMLKHWDLLTKPKTQREEKAENLGDRLRKIREENNDA